MTTTRAYISFPGLYSTYLDPQDLIESHREYVSQYLADKGFTEEEQSDYWDACDYAFDFREFARRTGSRWVDSYESMLNDLPGLEDVRLDFDSVDSPREYNFTTDACAVRIGAADLRRVRKYAETIARHERWAAMELGADGLSSADRADGYYTFADYVEKCMRPRDGFMPFYSNDVRQWGPVGEWSCAQIELLFDFVLPAEEVIGLDCVDEDLICDCEGYATANDPAPAEWLEEHRAEQLEEEAA